MKKTLKSSSYIVGIDEVGRGALAGPVVVAAVLISIESKAIIKSAKLGALKDSKKLGAKQREAWAKYFRQHKGVDFAVARVYSRGIERMNISAAANRAAEKAFTRLMEKHGVGSVKHVFLDGGLFLGSRVKQSRQYKLAKTVIKADENIPAVAAASIIAKVARDRFMVKLAVRYPRYHFDVHKGYGTAIHRSALAKYGPSDVHRLTFLHKKPIIKR